MMRVEILSLAFVSCAVSANNVYGSGNWTSEWDTPRTYSPYWYENIKHNGESSYMDKWTNSSCKAGYQVFRNVVTDFGADNTGVVDASVAIQKAIDAFSAHSTACPGRDNNTYGTTGQPAVVYLPRGKYLMANSIQMRLGTVLTGDPTDLPTLKVMSNFTGSHIIWGKDPAQGGTTNFYIAIRNLAIDSTAVDKDTNVTHIDWTVSQATQLSNMVFTMPMNSTGHIGVEANGPIYGGGSAGYNSNLILNDLTFIGGATGISLNGQQYVLKGMQFRGCNTAISVNAYDLVVHASNIADCVTGIDARSVSGSLTVMDTVGAQVGKLVYAKYSNSTSNSVILENVVSSGKTVVLDNASLPVLVGNVPGTWVRGNMYAPGNSTTLQRGKTLASSRSASLTANGGNYFTMKPPTYQDLTLDDAVNVKTVPGLPVHGDGVTDDSANINLILLANIGRLVYFPAGTYMVSDTICVPPGSRIVGDAFGSMISATGSTFSDADSPVAMVRVGLPGEVGIGQISDMLFTVSEVLPGCKLLEINMAGIQAGDVGVWNSHFRIGGAMGSTVKTECSTTPERCMAAWGLLHLTTSASAYIENMWGWTADHDLDGGPGATTVAPVISTGRGTLIEATQGTWMVGTGMEHHTLYQYNFNSAASVASIFQQSESAYWQGPGAPGKGRAPAPWTAHLQASDPTFDNCGNNATQCRMGWFELVTDSQDMFLYGGCDWVYFNGGVGNACVGSYCQRNAVGITNSTSTYLYGTNVKDISTMILSDGVDIALETDNKGGWGGVVAAYLHDSGA